MRVGIPVGQFGIRRLQHIAQLTERLPAFVQLGRHSGKASVTFHAIDETGEVRDGPAGSRGSWGRCPALGLTQGLLTTL